MGAAFVFCSLPHPGCVGTPPLSCGERGECNANPVYAFALHFPAVDEGSARQLRVQDLSGLRQHTHRDAQAVLAKGEVSIGCRWCQFRAFSITAVLPLKSAFAVRSPKATAEGRPISRSSRRPMVRPASIVADGRVRAAKRAQGARGREPRRKRSAVRVHRVPIVHGVPANSMTVRALCRLRPRAFRPPCRAAHLVAEHR